MFVASLQGAYCHRLFLGGRFVPRDSDPFSHHDKFEGQSFTRIELPFPHFCRCCSYIFPIGLPSSVPNRMNRTRPQLLPALLGHGHDFAPFLKTAIRTGKGALRDTVTILGHTTSLWPAVQHVPPAPPWPLGLSCLRAPGAVIYAALQDPSPSPSRRVRWRRSVTP